MSKHDACAVRCRHDAGVRGVMWPRWGISAMQLACGASLARREECSGRRVGSQRVSIAAERVCRVMCLRGGMTTGWRDRGTQVRMGMAMSDMTGDETTETRREV
jgi:hypothetical protein